VTILFVVDNILTSWVSACQTFCSVFRLKSWQR